MDNDKDAVIFKIEYLDFFADDNNERRLAEENKCQYILEGDFNNNNKPEIIISGLFSIKPIEGMYRMFVLILEEDEKGVYQKIYIRKLFKPVSSGSVENIQNMYLIHKKYEVGNDSDILIGFKLETGFTGRISWEKDHYSFEMVNY